MIKTTVTGADDAKQVLMEALDEFMTEAFLTVGIHEDDAGRDSDDITNATLGAIHEFGSEIDHPGGTPYGYSTEKDANAGKVRFLKRGEGYAVLGETEAHTVTIPARPWLAPGVESGNDEYLQIITDGIESGQTLADVLYMVGPVAVSKVQQYMTNLRSPANAPSTIARKGSSNPLIDTGEMKASVTFKVENVKPEEGIE